MSWPININQQQQNTNNLLSKKSERSFAENLEILIKTREERQKNRDLLSNFGRSNTVTMPNVDTATRSCDLINHLNNHQTSKGINLNPRLDRKNSSHSSTNSSTVGNTSREKIPHHNFIESNFSNTCQQEMDLSIVNNNNNNNNSNDEIKICKNSKSESIKSWSYCKICQIPVDTTIKIYNWNNSLYLCQSCRKIYYNIWRDILSDNYVHFIRYKTDLKTIVQIIYDYLISSSKFLCKKFTPFKDFRNLCETECVAEAVLKRSFQITEKIEESRKRKLKYNKTCKICRFKRMLFLLNSVPKLKLKLDIRKLEPVKHIYKDVGYIDCEIELHLLYNNNKEFFQKLADIFQVKMPDAPRISLPSQLQKTPDSSNVPINEKSINHQSNLPIILAPRKRYLKKEFAKLGNASISNNSFPNMNITKLSDYVSSGYFSQGEISPPLDVQENALTMERFMEPPIKKTVLSIPVPKSSSSSSLSNQISPVNICSKLSKKESQNQLPLNFLDLIDSSDILSKLYSLFTSCNKNSFRRYLDKVNDFKTISLVPSFNDTAESFYFADLKFMKLQWGLSFSEIFSSSSSSNHQVPGQSFKNKKEVLDENDRSMSDFSSNNNNNKTINNQLDKKFKYHALKVPKISLIQSFSTKSFLQQKNMNPNLANSRDPFGIDIKNSILTKTQQKFSSHKFLQYVKIIKKFYEDLSYESFEHIKSFLQPLRTLKIYSWEIFLERLDTPDLFVEHSQNILDNFYNLLNGNSNINFLVHNTCRILKYYYIRMDIMRAYHSSSGKFYLEKIRDESGHPKYCFEAEVIRSQLEMLTTTVSPRFFTDNKIPIPNGFKPFSYHGFYQQLIKTSQTVLDWSETHYSIIKFHYLILLCKSLVEKCCLSSEIDSVNSIKTNLQITKTTFLQDFLNDMTQCLVFNERLIVKLGLYDEMLEVYQFLQRAEEVNLFCLSDYVLREYFDN